MIINEKKKKRKERKKNLHVQGAISIVSIDYSRLPIGPIIMLLRDRKAERIGELVGDHVNFPAIDLHAACERISKKKRRTKRTDITDGSDDRVASIRGRNIHGDIWLLLIVKVPASAQHSSSIAQSILNEFGNLT